LFLPVLVVHSTSSASKPPIAADAAVDADLLAGLQIGAGERGAALVSDGGSREVHAVAIAVVRMLGAGHGGDLLPAVGRGDDGVEGGVLVVDGSVPVLDANVSSR